MELSRRDLLKGGVATSATAAAVGLGLDLKPVRAYAQSLRIKTAKVVPSVCPYCAVGCGQLIYVQDNKIQQIEGNPDCPHTLGTLCPKGQATYQLSINDLRPTKALYRAPGSDKWEEKPLDWMMGRIAELTKKTRDAGFKEKENGITVNRSDSLASLGSACTDNEECYLQAKLFRTLGLVYFEHQARI
ncbi:MAG TPA: twin-arginine translocation signal domain-containing protein [Candidatus Methylomirabilis sp.]|nr:twin-arginine translocation signal domain-containing protein [Candidatus Methylomirabilis sp.]